MSSRNAHAPLVAAVLTVLTAVMGTSCCSKQCLGPRSYIHKVERINQDSKEQMQQVTIMKPTCFAPAEVILAEKHVVVKVNNESDLEQKHQTTLTGRDVDDAAVFTGFRHAPFPPAVDHKQPVFRYYEHQMFLQPVTIALRFRGEALRDTVPAQATTGFNAGFALGWKLSKIYWRRNKNAFNSQTQRYSLGLGGLFSMGAVELNDKNTRAPRAQFPRSVPVLTYGAMVTLGLGSLNLGVAGGIDRTFTTQTDGWLYQGKPWWGLVLGLDVIK